MCGITGIFNFEAAEDLRQVIGAMNQALAHRGPDNDGIYANGPVHLGHRRLSIIDLSVDANQPFVSSDKRHAIVYNGELYNFRELRQELEKNYEFQTQTDTEVVLAAYRQWGWDCLKRFNGMFAFALWDIDREELWIARDRLGIKPLYLYQNERQLVFASEIRSLIKSGLFVPQLDQTSLIDYLRYQTVHAPNTILKDVRMLAPGSFMRVSKKGIEERTWWDPAKESKQGQDQLDDVSLKKEVRDRFYASVERRLVADVPFGAFLSGGIDSSAVVGAMSEVSNKQVRTFSVVFNEEEFSEARYARLISKRFNTDHQEIKLRPEDFLELLPNALKAMDHPSGDGPNTFVVSKVTREAGITMALSGLGGDELFAGYDIFKRSQQLENRKWLQSYPKFLRRWSGTALKKLRPGMASEKIAELLQLNYFDLWDTYPLSRQVLLDPVVHKLTQGRALPINKVFDMGADLIGKDSRQLPLFSQVSLLEMRTYMQNVLLRDTDQMSMAHALEVRVPFLDHTLVEWVMGIDDVRKFPHTPKQLLTDSLGDLLPREIIDRPKMGFVLPWANWMKQELRDLCEQKLQNLGDRSGLSGDYLQELWQAFLNDDPKVSWSRIWLLVVLENWLEEHHVQA